MKLIITIITLLLYMPSIHAQQWSAMTAKNVELKILGTSSVHDWESTVETVSIEAELWIEEDEIKGIQNAQLVAHSKSIESGKSIMNGKIYDALDVDTHPEITFQFLEMNKLSDQEVEITGNLHLAGISRKITVSSRYEPQKEGVRFVGNYTLDMR
ncbi:MAG: YceI family protein, partial [Bacteroidetes bacterium]|nr:YceI family protein [Bacteroidota bacterium]